MHFAIATPDNTSNARCEELAPPGRRSGEGTEALWQHMARDEQRKTSNRGGGLREGWPGQEASHPRRRSTDRFPT